MATYQLKYGGVIAETPITIGTTFTEGSVLTLTTTDSNGFSPIGPGPNFPLGCRFVYTGNPFSRPDIQEAASVKAVFGPSIIETDVISDFENRQIGDILTAKNGMLTLLTSDDNIPLGWITDIGAKTATVHIFF